MSKEKLIKRNITSYISPRTSQKGITLIALVVTIIVMLILAAVTINMVTGDESVIKQAKSSRDKQEAGKDLEIIQTAVSAQNIELAISGGVIDSNYTNAVEAEIEKKLGPATVIANADGKSLTVAIGTGPEARVYPVKLGDGSEVIVSTPAATATTTVTQAPATTTPTATLTPTPTTAPNTVTVTYKLGIETVATEEVEPGTTVGYGLENNFNSNWTTSFGYRHHISYGISTNPLENTIYNKTYTVNEDTILYGYPNMSCLTTIDDSTYLGLISMEAMQNAGFVSATSSSQIRSKCVMC